MSKRAEAQQSLRLEEQETLDELVSGMFLKDAFDVNSHGRDRQIEYLLDRLWPEKVSPWKRRIVLFTEWGGITMGVCDPGLEGVEVYIVDWDGEGHPNAQMVPLDKYEALAMVHKVEMTDRDLDPEWIDKFQRIVKIKEYDE